jgi:hypothetical protein
MMRTIADTATTAIPQCNAIIIIPHSAPIVTIILHVV